MSENWINWLALVQTVLMVPPTIATLRTLVHTLKRHARKQEKEQV
jgi:fructose-specific phosphotransferase system IIC component